MRKTIVMPWWGFQTVKIERLMGHNMVYQNKKTDHEKSIDEMDKIFYEVTGATSASCRPYDILALRRCEVAWRLW